MVAQVALYGFDIISCLQGGHCIAVPQIMQPGIRNIDRSRDPLKRVIDGTG